MVSFSILGPPFHEVKKLQSLVHGPKDLLETTYNQRRVVSSVPSPVDSTTFLGPQTRDRPDPDVSNFPPELNGLQGSSKVPRVLESFIYLWSLRRVDRTTKI